MSSPRVEKLRARAAGETPAETNGHAVSVPVMAGYGDDDGPHTIEVGGKTFTLAPCPLSLLHKFGAALITLPTVYFAYGMLNPGTRDEDLTPEDLHGFFKEATGRDDIDIAEFRRGLPLMMFQVEEDEGQAMVDVVYYSLVARNEDIDKEWLGLKLNLPIFLKHIRRIMGMNPGVLERFLRG